MKRRYSVGLGPFGPCADRFNPSGYRDSLSLHERVELASTVGGLDGLELHYPAMFKDVSVDEWERMLAEHNWACSIVSICVWEQEKWARGSLTNTDPQIRDEAIQVVKEGLHVAERLGANRVNLWLGQDGHDYPLQKNYQQSWELLIDGLRECAQHNPNVNICLEYKVGEPRTRMMVANIGKSLWLCRTVGLPNVGVNLDVGHALQAGENPAESAVLLAMENRLFHLHFNDNYGDWDWDMIPGTVHYWETLELCYWLERLGYEGWYSFDLFPAREDPVQAVSTSIRIIEKMTVMIRETDGSMIEAALREESYPEIVEKLMGL